MLWHHHYSLRGHRQQKRGRGGHQGHVPPLEIILLYCATPAVLVRWAWPMYFMHMCNARSHREWQNRAWSVVSEGTANFSLLVRMPPTGDLVQHCPCINNWDEVLERAFFQAHFLCRKRIPRMQFPPTHNYSEVQRSNSFVACPPCCSNLPRPMEGTTACTLYLLSQLLLCLN